MMLEVLAIFNLIFSVFSDTPAPENKYLTYIQAVMRKVLWERMVSVSHNKSANWFQYFISTQLGSWSNKKWPIWKENLEFECILKFFLKKVWKGHPNKQIIFVLWVTWRSFHKLSLPHFVILYLNKHNYIFFILVHFKTLPLFGQEAKPDMTNYFEFASQMLFYSHLTHLFAQGDINIIIRIGLWTRYINCAF